MGKGKVLKSCLVIADIAGQFDALTRLVAKVPKSTIKLSLGDMCDRGPRSKEVFEYFMDGYGKDKFALMGNHEHLMVNTLLGSSYRCYSWQDWPCNGGNATLDSYPNKEVPKEVLTWINALPLTMEFEGAEGMPKMLASHAPLYHPIKDLPVEPSTDQICEITWNRYPPIYREGYFQIFGHNSHWGLRQFLEDGQTNPFALCIDQSRKQILTGYLFPEGEILEVPYTD